MLRDVVPCRDYHEVCRMLGLVPAGPEVDQVEHYQSHMRIEAFNRVAEEVFPHADIAADMLYRLACLNRDGEDCEIDEDDPERDMFTAVSRTAVAAVIGHLLEKGTLGVSR
ncbi:hypothetical protein [Streptomyces sp. NBC_01451]|uniref:hypothetical protein n=1 Tax=Streptomyces sp. NBC_01451 TaxID=2903872 RepID=UPI002E3467AC|nr:hypothetical protein [Streptomyces sp. NBC_01451]